MTTKNIRYEYHDNGHCTIYINEEDICMIGLTEGYGSYGIMYKHSDKPISKELRLEGINFIRECEGWCRSDCTCNKCIIKKIHDT
jgi:hypothetical protein